MRWTRVDEREKAQVRQNKAIRIYHPVSGEGVQ